jgi:hypothetical protein
MGEVIESAGEGAPAYPVAYLQKSPRRVWYLTFAWWLVPAICIAILLWTNVGATTERHFDHVNGVAGELMPGYSVGQSFIARYPNLSGVEIEIGTYREVPGPSKASLVLHLRSTRGSSPELATAHIAAGQELGVNPSYLFSFPPIPDSQDKTFYLEVESPDGEHGEALTVFWFKQLPGVGSDSYQPGSALVNRGPYNADLAFGLRYSPSPLAAWAQMARAASVNLPLGVMISLVLVLLAVGTWATLRLPRIIRDLSKLKRWLARWSLPIVLAIAFINGMLYVLLVPLWQGPDEHSHFVYAALLDRYDMDDEKVKALDVWGKDRPDALLSSVAASMSRHNFSRLVTWHSAPGAAVQPDPNFIQQVRQPPAYYWLCAAALRTLRLLGVNADPYANPDGALKVMRVVSLGLSLGVVVLAWILGTLLSPTKPWLRLMIPLSIALLPMHTFVASTANNDILAELAVSALFVTLVALVRWLTGARGVGLAALAVLVTIAGFSTKATAQAASIPLLGLGLLVWIGILLTGAVQRWRTRRGAAEGRARPMIIPAIMTLLVLLSGLSLGVFAVKPQEEVAGWYVRYWDVEWAQRVATTTAHDGSYVIQLEPSRGRSSTWQVLAPTTVDHPEMALTLSGWARLRANGVQPPPDAVKAEITINEGGRQAGKGEILLDPLGAWGQITAGARISSSAEAVIVTIAADGNADGATIEFDDFTLNNDTPDDAWGSAIYGVKLVNPSAEVAALGLRPELARLLPFEASQMADVLANPQPFDKGALWGYYADMQHRSFWGNFGWVSIPLPEWIYTLLGFFSLISVAGLAWRGVRLRGAWGAGEWLGLVTLIALVVAVLVGFTKQMAYMATQNGAAYPQGRYLFVLIVPLVWLLVTGLWEAWSLAWLGGRTVMVAIRRQPSPSVVEDAEKHPAGGAPTRLMWGVWIYANMIFLLGSYCLLSLIVPYYYG